MASMKPENYTMFTKSSPWGYHPQQVENQIKEYEKVTNTLYEKYTLLRQTNYKMAAKIEQLQNELRDMHLQMSSLELPEASEAVEHFVLDDFKKYNSNNNNDDIPSPNIIQNDGVKSRNVKNEYNSNNDDEFEIIT